MASAAEEALNDVIVRPRAKIFFYKRQVRLDIWDEEVVRCYHLDRELIILLLDRICREIAKSGKRYGIDAELQVKNPFKKTNIYNILILNYIWANISCSLTSIFLEIWNL